MAGHTYEFSFSLHGITCCLSQTQNRAAYYSANQLAQLRPSPRWTTQGVRPQRMYIYAISFYVKLTINFGVLFLLVATNISGSKKISPFCFRLPKHARRYAPIRTEATGFKCHPSYCHWKHPGSTHDGFPAYAWVFMLWNKCTSLPLYCRLFGASLFTMLSHTNPGSACCWRINHCRCSSTNHAPVQVCCRCAQPPAAHGLPATGTNAAGKI